MVKPTRAFGSTSTYEVLTADLRQDRGVKSDSAKARTIVIDDRVTTKPDPKQDAAGSELTASSFT